MKAHHETEVFFLKRNQKREIKTSGKRYLLSNVCFGLENELKKKKTKNPTTQNFIYFFSAKGKCKKRKMSVKEYRKIQRTTNQRTLITTQSTEQIMVAFLKPVKCAKKTAAAHSREGAALLLGKLVSFQPQPKTITHLKIHIFVIVGLYCILSVVILL